jgi:hypothetical protein
LATQISVYPKGHDLSQVAPHRCTATLAARVQAAHPHSVQFNSESKVLRLLVASSWNEIKRGLRPEYKTVQMELVQDSGMPLMLSYPQLGQESDALRRRRETWMKAEKF